MPRVRKGAARSRKHKKILKATRGQIGAASRHYRVAREAYIRAGQYATIGRKLKKRDFRRLWITRISAACRQRGLTYSRFINALSTSGISINRKSLADIAISDPDAFDKIVAAATTAKKPAATEAPIKPEPVPAPPEAKKETPEKKTPAKKAEKKPAAEKAAPEETPAKEVKKTAAEKAAPAKAVKKTATKKTAAKKELTGAKADEKTVAKKTAAKKTLKKKAASAKTTKKTVVKKTTKKKTTATKKSD